MHRHIPPGWEEKPLIDLCEKSKRAIVDGPFGSNLKIIHYRKSGVPIITSGYVTDGVFKADEYLYVDEEKFRQEIRSKVQGGDIVMAKIGARCGASAIMPEKHPVGLLSGNALKITVDEKQNSTKYVWYYLDWLNRNGKLAGIKATGAQPAVSVPSLKKLPILRPPHDEQNRIVEILSIWDRAIETSGRLIDAKTKLKKGLMQKLLTGKIRFNEFKNDKWTDIQIKNVGKVVTGNTPPKDDTANYGTIFSWATADDFKSKYVANTSVKLSEKGKLFCRILPKGSVLVTCIASIGKNAIAGECLATNQQINAIIVDKNIYDNEIIYYVMELHKRKMLALAGKTAVPIINKSTFEKMRIHLPENIAEQKLISRILASIDREIEILIKKRERLGSQRRGLMQKLLTGKIRVKGVTQ